MIIQRSMLEEIPDINKSLARCVETITTAEVLRQPERDEKYKAAAAKEEIYRDRYRTLRNKASKLYWQKKRRFEIEEIQNLDER